MNAICAAATSIRSSTLALARFVVALKADLR